MKINRVKTYAIFTSLGEICAIGDTIKGNIGSETVDVVRNGGWIHVSERRPTKRDADRDGMVKVWSDKHYTDVEWPHQLVCKANDIYWQPCPKAPKKIGKKGRK